MALEGQKSIVAIHAVAVVGDANQLPAAGFNIHPNAIRAGIERILEQLLHHRRRAVDDLAGGDLVGDLIGENTDAAHNVLA